MEEIKPVFVAVLYYEDWPARMLKSLRKHFPNEPLVVVNHLQTPLMREDYVDKKTTMIFNGSGWNAGGHGGGMDAAFSHLRNRKDVTHMVHIEPDCTFSGREWYEDMIGR